MRNLRTLLRRTIGSALLVGALLTLPATTEAAGITYTFDTSSLNPAAGLYSLDFQLTSNDQSGANVATISNLAIAGGALLPTQYWPSSGGAAGDLSSSVTLTTTDFFNSFTQDFLVGSMLSFVLDLTNIAPTGLIPDAFSFGILLNGTEVATLDPTPASKLLRLDLTGGSAPMGGQFGLPPAAPVPEPGTYLMVGVGMLIVGLRMRRRA